jgi:N-acetylmuramoyl-L-alanine amidase
MLLAKWSLCLALLFTQDIPVHVSPDILIDVGHGGLDGGTGHGDLLEKDINLQISRLLYKQLSAQGYHVVLDRIGDYALSEDNRWLKIRSRHIRDLAQRKEIANLLKPKLLISLHVNWSANKKKSGPLTLHQKNEHSILLAHLLLQHLNSLYGNETFPDLPIYGKRFYLLKYVTSPAVILEMGYISNDSDRKRLTEIDGQKQIAAAIGAAVDQYLRKIK